MPQITLVSDEHDHNVAVGVVSKFLQPTEDVDVGSVFRDIVHEQGSDSSSVVPVECGSRQSMDVTFVKLWKKGLTQR